MSILNGHKKFKRYIKNEDDTYSLESDWTSASTVEFADGNTAEEKITQLNTALGTKADKTAIGTKIAASLSGSTLTLTF